MQRPKPEELERIPKPRSEFGRRYVTGVPLERSYDQALILATGALLGRLNSAFGAGDCRVSALPRQVPCRLFDVAAGS